MNDTTEHDPTISAAYDRLTEQVRPPGDGLQRVQRRMSVRRRRRRAAVGVAALAVVGGATLAAVTTGGEPDRAVDVATQPGPEPLSTTLSDGSVVVFEGIEVTCEDGLIVAQNEHRLARGAGDEARLAEPFVYLEVRPDQVSPGETFTLPVDGPGGSDTYPVLLFFALDDDTAGDSTARANELSSAVGGASGTVEVREATCGPEPRLALTVDAVLGSEVGQESMPLTGELR
ncbi:hypothetical protein [Nocardioides deserti]|uniref:DUF4352 domain-containing protein n=1 Tax=Nocardioides deserti TaxID=1588644 RepID=A0ABR6UDG5_9ACTN|nr:hypothetical protein [Nocardioides deserti]MBC2962497.1 hypothetical protein [Nocardioides deserti]GGO72762.1 hypothetical protein GCM10012276_16730 [Nocardioides deserti]